MLLSGRKSPTENPSVFIREVPASEFITGAALASQIGLTAGVSLHSTAGWLHFEDEGKTKYISKRPLRHTVSWDELNAVGAVFGTKTAIINGDTYKVRLLSGANTNPSTAVNGSFDHAGTHGCEWNRLLYHISAKPFTNGNNRLASEGIVVGDWASYSEADLVTSYIPGNGSYNWCQETGTEGTQRITRGSAGVSYLYQGDSSYAGSSYGWRPVLELVP